LRLLFVVSASPFKSPQQQGMCSEAGKILNIVVIVPSFDRDDAVAALYGWTALQIGHFSAELSVFDSFKLSSSVINSPSGMISSSWMDTSDDS
jgi:hypothetical protein